MQITLIRHLPTNWNKKGLLQGKRDLNIAKVSEGNLQKINRNILKLEKHAPFDLVLSSTLKRTHQTAKQYSYHPKMENLLDELDFGIFEGKPKDHLSAHFGKQWIENPRHITLGETMVSLEKRIIKFLMKYQGYSSILLFGHGAWIRALLSYAQTRNISNMNKIHVQPNDMLQISILQTELPFK